jgi:hypothetical protein
MRELLAPGQGREVRLAATVALGRLGDPASTDVLALLLDPGAGEHDHRLARAAATSLVQLGQRGRQALREAAYVAEAGEVLAGLEPPTQTAPATRIASTVTTGGAR